MFNKKDFQSCYTDAGKKLLSGSEEEPLAEPFSIAEVNISDDGSVWLVYQGPPGIMVTHGELAAMSFMSDEEQARYAIFLKNTRAVINRSEPHPHQWVE